MTISEHEKNQRTVVLGINVGEVGIFVVNGDVYIKELGNKCLISHNEKYNPIRIGESDSGYCCGRVIGIVG